MININITSNSNQPFEQVFSFYTEVQWNTDKSKFDVKIDTLFSGKKNETFLFVENETIHFLIGMGATPEQFNLSDIAAQFSWDYRKKIQPTTTLFKVSNFNKEEVSAIIKGLYLGTYHYPFKADHPLFHDQFSLILDETATSDIEKFQRSTKAICEGQFACMEWLNKPQNFKQVPQISEFLDKIAEKYNFKKTVFNREESSKKGLGAFLAVNQGSSQEAAFTILEYRCSDPKAKTVGLVGKCVLFDTGGISIKGSDNLHYMKSDMGGATAVIGTLITAAELELPINLVAILPITDNAVSNTAYIPSDVVRAYNGKTIEVLNTDAEGRMTLADGLSYLSINFETDALIDLATLTGSAVRMFGYTCGAYFSNNNDLKRALENAGDATNQRLWNLPLWDVWKDDFKSDVADFKNISSKPFGDCIVAGKFLEQFIEGHKNWAHLDIAGVAFGNVRYMHEKGATGYGVQLLINFLEKF